MMNTGMTDTGMMNTVKLGHSELRVSRLGLGCMGMSDFYGARDEAESIATLHRALDLGVNFLDTADMYGVGKNERLLKKALVDAGRRNEIVLATKFAIRRDPASGQILGVSGKPDYVREACDRSLERLGVDHIDLYYQHRVDPETPIEDTVAAMAGLVAAGKVRYLGLSEASAETIRRAHAVHPISAVQTEYSLWTRDVEAGVLPTCRELGISLVAYSPLGRGFLTGTIRSTDDLAEDDWRRQNPRFTGTHLEANLALVEEVEAVAGRVGATPAQVALAWLLSRGEEVVPIPGTKRRQYLEDNVAAVAVRLSAEDLKQLSGLGKATGQRYPEAAMRFVNG